MVFFMIIEVILKFESVVSENFHNILNNRDSLGFKLFRLLKARDKPIGLFLCNRLSKMLRPVPVLRQDVQHHRTIQLLDFIEPVRKIS